MLIAAASEGVYGVTRIPFTKEIGHLKEILDIPAEYEIPCYLALGYPSQGAAPIPQHRIKAEERAHFNKW